jgi:hypothetical protein
MVSYPLFLLGVLLIAFPGICYWMVLFPKDSVEQRLAWGSVLGFGTAIYLAYVCAFVHLSWFYVVWAATLILSVGILAWRGLRGYSSPRDRTVAGESLILPRVALALLLTVVFVLQIDAVTHQLVPLGWDPSFHLLLAKKIALSDYIIRDWQPFENAALNYPIGSHLLIALFAGFSGLPLPRVFQLLMVTFNLLSALAIYALASEYFASEMVGLYAAIAYSLWAFTGSTDYLRWGGLPNQLGMLLGLGIFSLVMRVDERRKRTMLMAMLFAAVCLTHHHVMLTMGLVLTALMGFFWATADPEKRYRTIFLALVMGSVAAAFFLIPYTLKAPSLSQTKVLHMKDRWPVLGPVLVGFAFTGAVLDYLRKAARLHVFHFVAAILLLLYALFAWVFYFYQYEMKGVGSVAFTPSRFITDLVYFLSIFAGYAFYRIQEYLGWRPPIMIAIALSLGYVNYPLWEQVFLPNDDPGRFAAYDWIQSHTPANSIVLTDDSWACYATWRRTLRTPMPVSEPRVSPRISKTAKREMLEGGAPGELRGVQVLDVLKPGARAEGKVLWSNPDGWEVSELYSGRPNPFLK